MNNTPPPMSKLEKDLFERRVLDDPLLQELSHYKDGNTRRRSGANNANPKDSIDNKIQDVNSDLLTRGSMVIPVKWDGKSLKVEKNMKTSIVCGIPASVNNGRWSATMSGTSSVRGPIGSTSGSLNLTYHPPIVKGSQLHGGIQVGDNAALSIGASIRQDNKSSIGVSVVSQQRTSSLIPTLSAQHRFDPCLVSSRITLGPSRPAQQKIGSSWSLAPSWNVSVSPSLKRHKVQLGVGWNRSQPLLSMMVSSKISAHRRGNVSIQWRPSGGLSFGGVLTQSLASKVASLSVGLQWCKKRLEWIFTWHRGDVTVQIPIHITQYSNVWMNCLQVAYLSFVSQVIQDAIADLWKLSNDPTETEALRKEQTRLKRDKARRDAERQRQLMTKQAQSRAKQEQAKQGLVIRRAIYQVEGGDAWDVTNQLQFWTEDSSLELPPSSKKDLLGFYNVAGSESNRSSTNDSWFTQLWSYPDKEETRTAVPFLCVQYYYAGRLYEITVRDEEQLVLPSSKAVPAAAK